MWTWIKNLFKRKQETPVVILPEQTQIELPPVVFDETKINFELALIYTFENEGTLSNDKFDKGGITKYGIILDDLTRMGQKNATSEDIKNLTKEQAKNIYKKLYWDKLNLDEISNKGVAICLFDIGVVRGTGVPPKYCAEICGEFSPYAINKYDSNDFILKFSERSASGFKQIVARNPTQKRFLNGWLNRAKRLQGLRNQ